MSVFTPEYQILLENALFREDTFLLICSFLHWRTMVTMIKVCNYFKKIIRKHSNKFITTVCTKSESTNLVNSKFIFLDKYILRSYQRQELHHDFYSMVLHEQPIQNCYHLDFSYLQDFDWFSLVCFDNKCHYLSLRGTSCGSTAAYYQNYRFNSDTICWDSKSGRGSWSNLLGPILNGEMYISEENISDNNDECSFTKFIRKNFTWEDINLYLGYKDFLDYHVSQHNPDYYKSAPSRESDEQRYIDLLSYCALRFDFDRITILPENTQIYYAFVERIKNDIVEIKQRLYKYKCIVEWFKTAEIDVIDISGTYLPNFFLKYLIGCKKIINDKLEKNSGTSNEQIIMSDHTVQKEHSCDDEEKIADMSDSGIDDLCNNEIIKMRQNGRLYSWEQISESIIKKFQVPLDFDYNILLNGKELYSGSAIVETEPIQDTAKYIIEKQYESDYSDQLWSTD